MEHFNNEELFGLDPSRQVIARLVACLTAAIAFESSLLLGHESRRVAFHLLVPPDLPFGVAPRWQSRLSRASRSQHGQHSFTRRSAKKGAPRTLREAIWAPTGAVSGVTNISDLGHRLRRVVDYVVPLLLLAPGSSLRLQWDVLSVVLVLYTAAVLPYRVCFARPWGLEWAVADVLVDVFFCADVVLTFFTTYIHDGFVINSYAKVGTAANGDWRTSITSTLRPLRACHHSTYPSLLPSFTDRPPLRAYLPSARRARFPPL